MMPPSKPSRQPPATPPDRQPATPPDRQPTRCRPCPREGDAPSPSPAAELGRWGERLARLFLESCRLTCVAERYRCPGGEIDLVMAAPDLLVFVEVKTRGPGACGRPEDAVRHVKLARLRRAARHYLWQRPPPRPVEVRFDVVAVEVRGEGRGLVLRHLAGVR
ncbi:MAG: YraN family protein [Candidatus Krumholzibacteriia bacterium]